MLGDNYLVFENVPLPNPVAKNTNYDNLETIKQSVSGKDMDIIQRLQKRTFNCTFQCTSYWLDRYRQMCRLSEGDLVYRGETIRCRARIISDDQLADSEYAARTDGLYTVSITFTEV